MNCPVCKNTNLVMSERQGIEIDYCPQCRGVWLDRGELDKMIERAVEGSSGERGDYEKRDYSDQHRSSHDQREPYREGHYKKKKREGFLSDLFDFD
ncbi:MAG TPA: zf-TFIIB domain-containing protein [Pyrinomonadaceae bacterium]|nr:zf-TFIIB domain-containing protein [Pyrinomonadaceae bacterium]